MHPLQAEALKLKRARFNPANGRMSSELEIVSEAEARRRVAARVAAERRAAEAARAEEERAKREALAAVIKRLNAPQAVLWNPKQLFELFIAAHRRTGFEYGMPQGKGPVSFRQILEVTCRHFLVGIHSVLGVGRSATLVRPRMIVMFLAREHIGMTFSQIGRRLGKDHTSCMHGHRKIGERIAAGDEAVIAAVTVIRDELGT